MQDHGAYEKWIELFQWFHRHPEIGFQEYETTRKIREVAGTLHLKNMQGGLETGHLALIEGKYPGKEIAIRADIDALPVCEESGLPYASENYGVMHACGHDFHITALLWAASFLAEKTDSLHGRLWLIFQPAEESVYGAQTVLAREQLCQVKEFYGFHADPRLDTGVIGITEGSVTASVDRFRIDIAGKGAHGATPHLGKNPLDVMNGLAQTLTGFARRPVAALDPSVISITQMHGGSSWNIIPDTAFMEGTVRTFSIEARKEIEAGFDRIIREYALLTETEIRLEWVRGCSSIVNDASLCEFAGRMAAELGRTAVRQEKTMTGDDFSLYGEVVSGSRSLYLRIGTGRGPALHHPAFAVDPAALPMTAEYLAKLLAERMRNCG